MTLPALDLAGGIRLAGLDYPQLWTRCLALRGSGDLDTLRAHVEGRHCPDDHDHNIIVQALNDTFLEQGREHPVTYPPPPPLRR